MTENTGDLFEKMVQSAADTKKSAEQTLAEESQVIGNNVQLLHDCYIEGNSAIRSGMWAGERMFGTDRSLLLEGIKITYNAHTGEIMFPAGDYDDETFRILRTWSLTYEQPVTSNQSGSEARRIDGKKYHAIQIVHAKGNPTSEDITAAMTQSTFYEDEKRELQIDPVDIKGSDRFIKPEQVLRDYDWFDYQCPIVQKADFQSGDHIFFKSLEEFNRQYWLPAEQELFEKTGTNAVVTDSPEPNQDSSMETDDNPKPSFLKRIRSWFKGKAKN